MRKIFFCIIFFCLSVFAEEQLFLPYTEDVPLMADIKITSEDDGMLFDTPMGQVLQVTGESMRPISEVADYYEKVLPSFGWQQTKGLLFVRQQDTLLLELKPYQEKTLIWFELQTQNDKD